MFRLPVVGRVGQRLDRLFTDTAALPTVKVTATYNARTPMGSTIQFTGDGNDTTSFMKFAGFPTLDINTSSMTTISNMQPACGANQPIGLAWAWMTLQQARR